MSREKIKKMVSHYFNVTKSIHLELDKYTIQIFFKSEKGIIAYGSAILVRYQDHYFILSAAHVLEMDDMPNLYFEMEKELDGTTTFKNLGKYALLTSQKKNKTRENDKIDIAVLKLLSSDDIELFKSNFSFYNFEEADINHNPINEIPYYVIFGYPGKQTKFKNKYRNESERRLFVLNSRTKEFKECDKYGFSLESNIFIDYPKQIQKEGNNQLLSPPDPSGISGCGLWKITDSVNLQTKNWHYELVGIMIEVHDKRILVGTKLLQIDAIIKYINKEKSA